MSTTNEGASPTVSPSPPPQYQDRDQYLPEGTAIEGVRDSRWDGTVATIHYEQSQGTFFRTTIPGTDFGPITVLSTSSRLTAKELEEKYGLVPAQIDEETSKQLDYLRAAHYIRELARSLRDLGKGTVEENGGQDDGEKQ